jgi:hypothetical protein
VTIQDLGSIGELIAAIATVATLVYLAIQIRQNTVSNRDASVRSTHDMILRVNTPARGRFTTPPAVALVGIARLRVVPTEPGVWQHTPATLRFGGGTGRRS